MTTSVEWLDMAKNRLKISTKYKLAKQIGCTLTSISNIYSGKSTMGDEIALKVAHLLDADPAIVVISCHLERAKSPPLREALESALTRLTP